MTDALMRMQERQRNMSDVTAEIDALAASMPEPVESVDEALRSLSVEQRESLWANRAEAMQLLSVQASEVQQRAEQLVEQLKSADSELHTLFAGSENDHFDRMRDLILISQHAQDQMQQLQIELGELNALYSTLHAHTGSSPTLAPP